MYIIGVSYAYDVAYVSFGEEMHELFPYIPSKDKRIICLFALITSSFSWIGALYFYKEHKSFIKTQILCKN